MDAVARNARRYFGDRGVAWVLELPSIVERVADRWDLRVEGPYAGLSINYVAPAALPDGTRCVVKIGVPNRERLAEIDALRIWDGRGAVRQLAFDVDLGAQLLERLEPGTNLVELAAHDDDAATDIAAATMRELWRSAPVEHELYSMAEWLRALLGDPAPTPALFERGQALARQLVDSTDDPVVVHGDLHHFNILAAERAPWVAIDPKGIVGDRAFDLAALLRNPDTLELPVVRRRFDILTAALGLERGRARDWCFVEAMLNARWCQVEDPEWLGDRLEWAEVMLSL